MENSGGVFHAMTRGRGRGDFLHEAAQQAAALLLPLSRPQAISAAAVFFLPLFLS